MLVNSQLLLGCSGPGATAATEASERFGLHSLGACVGVLLLVVVMHQLRRQWLTLAACLSAVVLHPYWWERTDKGDCGYGLVADAGLVTIVVCAIALWAAVRLAMKRWGGASKQGVATLHTPPKKWVPWVVWAGLPLSLAAAAYTYTRFVCTDCVPGVYVSPLPYIIRPDTCLRATLAVRASAGKVTARLTLTNRTDRTLRLYKPLLGEGPITEKIFVVCYGARQEVVVPFAGRGVGPYVNNDSTEPVTLPRIPQHSTIALAAGATHTVTVDLGRYYQFKHSGQYTARYDALLPVIENGKHLHEKDPQNHTFFAPSLPVYFAVLSGTGPHGDTEYAKFTVP